MAGDDDSAQVRGPVGPAPSAVPNPAGLTSEEATRRLREDGPNELEPTSRLAFLTLVADVLREPMFVLLLGAAALYFVMRDWGDGALLVVFVLLVIVITIVQRRRTDTALARLRVLASPRAHVVRDGVMRRVPGRDVVVGDLLVLDEGDRVAADARLVRGGPLEVDESLLTGESVAVYKRAPGEDGADTDAEVASGTMVTSGHAIGLVVATGKRSRLGQIGRLLGEITTSNTPLQLETQTVAKRLAVFAVVVAAIVVIAHGLSRGGSLAAWRDGALVGIATAMSLLPEELPVVMTVYLAIGAWRIAQRRVLTRNMPAIEALGAATVLCVDKTGTLTQNRMRLAELVPFGSREASEVLRVASRASRQAGADPIDVAIVDAAARAALPPVGPCARDYPLSPTLTAVGRVYAETSAGTGAGGGHVCIKGAPETIVRLCRLQDGRDLTSQEGHTRQWLDERVAALARDGRRVLAVAEGTWASSDPLPEALTGFDVRLVGLVAFEDPIRDEVPSAVEEARSAGIRVVMLTGDHPETALAIARRACLARTERAVTGPEIANLSDDELRVALNLTDVVARVAPEQKLRIVQALRDDGHVTAMTGDGVNDAPALRAAHIGIAMGSRGSDVAREAADLVLVDDDFASIVGAIRLGRRVYDNLRRAIAFILAVHVPIAGLALLPVFVPGWPILLLPAHVVLLELIIDPTCSLVFEADPPDTNVMSRPPRALDTRLFSAALIRGALLEGGWVFMSCAAVAALMVGTTSDEGSRAAVFVTLVTGFLATILVQRADGRAVLPTLIVKNPALWAVLVVAPLLLVSIFAVPFLRQVFAFELVETRIVLACLGAGLTPFVLAAFQRFAVRGRTTKAA